MSASKDSLPELPPLGVSIGGTLLKGFSVGDEHADAYSGEAVRAYGLACYQAGLERGAVIADDFENPRVLPNADADKEMAEQMSALLRFYFSGVAAAIRSEKQR